MAIVIIPLCFLVKLMARVKIHYFVALITTTVIGVICMNGEIIQFLSAMLFLLASLGNDYISSQVDFSPSLEVEISPLRLIYAYVYCFPVIYFSYYSKRDYTNNVILRTCVNLSWLVMVWRLFSVVFGSTIFSRPFDYLLFFALWGYAYMFRDIFLKRRSFPKIIITVAFIGTLLVSEIKAIYMYHGWNSYMTVFSHDCIEQNYYVRDVDNINATRIRR